MRVLAGMLAAVFLAGTGHPQVGGNLAQFPPVDVRIDITTDKDGKPILTPSEIKLVTGDYYRLTFSSDGQGKDNRGEPLARRIELNEFLANIHLRILTISGIEVHLQGMSFRAIELDEKGEASSPSRPSAPATIRSMSAPTLLVLEGRPASRASRTTPRSRSARSKWSNPSRKRKTARLWGRAVGRIKE